jgi:twitching motility two-component system response regulator PilH
MTVQRILIVEDSPTDRHFLVELLTRHGYQVSTAETAEDAMVQSRQIRPDLIIMDVVLPGASGYQATRQLARDRNTQTIPIFICSSRVQESDKVWGLRQGARDYIPKPVDQRELLNKIAALS